MLRAGPFSDQDVVALLNRRFVSFFFDLSTQGAAGDAVAREAVVAVRPKWGGMSVSTPTVLLLSPDGKVLGEFDNYATEQQVLTALLRVLEEHPEYGKPAAGEDDGSALERARVLVELQQFAAAEKLLASAGGDGDAPVLLLRAQLMRRGGDAKAAAELLSRIDDAALQGDVRMERALLHWDARDDAGLSEALGDFPMDHPRSSEARYYRGLALFHTGDVDGAKAEWQGLIKAVPQDRWVYRADWAFSQAGTPQRGIVTMSSSAKRTPLGRIGYMGRRNPDLVRR